MANYLIRLRVNTHVTVALVSRLPVPVVRRGHPFVRIDSASLSAALAHVDVTGRGDGRNTRELQALCARLYGLRREEFEHVLGTFPLDSGWIRGAALAAFDDLH